MTTPILAIENLVVSLGQGGARIIDDVSLEVRERETLCQPQLLRPQHEVVSHVGDLICAVEIDGAVTAGEHHQDRARVRRSGVQHALAAA